MTTKHTPGPWLSACNHRWGHQVVARAAGGGTVTIAHLGNLEFDEDNARLIAAAPDLLAALEAAHGYLVLFGTDQLDHVRSVCRAAIAKAKGKTP